MPYGILKPTVYYFCDLDFPIKVHFMEDYWQCPYSYMVLSSESDLLVFGNFFAQTSETTLGFYYKLYKFVYFSQLPTRKTRLAHLK